MPKDSETTSLKWRKRKKYVYSESIWQKSCKNEGKVKTFSDIWKLRESTATRSALQ